MDKEQATQNLRENKQQQFVTPGCLKHILSPIILRDFQPNSQCAHREFLRCLQLFPTGNQMHKIQISLLRQSRSVYQPACKHHSAPKYLKLHKQFLPAPNLILTIHVYVYLHMYHFTFTSTSYTLFVSIQPSLLYTVSPMASRAASPVCSQIIYHIQ